jgi:outer membrane protein assembly factor BamB
MKINRLVMILLFSLLAVVLTSCSGAGVTNSWSGVTAAEDLIYFSDGAAVFALRSDSGNTAWKYPEKANAKRLFYAEPVVAGEQVIVVDYANTMASLNAQTGVETWVFEGAKGRYVDCPLILDNLIIAPNADYSLYALDLSGKLVWKFETGHALWARPSTDGETLYFASMDRNFYAVDVASGTMKWKKELHSSSVARALLDESTVYVGNLEGKLFAFNTADGSLVWEQQLGGGIWSAPLLHEGKLYIGDQTGRISILTSADGKVEQFIETGSAILGAGVVLDNGVAFGNEDGSLVVIGFDGARLWTRSFDGKLYSNLQMNGDHILLSLSQGEKPLLAVDLNGNEIWNFSDKK